MIPEEINREIAEKVMRWHIQSNDPDSIHEPEWWEADEGENVGPNILVKYWNPYERIEHAWMVVEKLKTAGYYPLFWHVTANNEWAAQFGDGDAYADTAPAAICKAALEAIKEKP